MFTEGLGRILRWYKGRCTFEIHKKDSCFCWQERFWDTIIWDLSMLERVRHYIESNVKRWQQEEHNVW